MRGSFVPFDTPFAQLYFSEPGIRSSFSLTTFPENQEKQRNSDQFIS